MSLLEYTRYTWTATRKATRNHRSRTRRGGESRYTTITPGVWGHLVAEKDPRTCDSDNTPEYVFYPGVKFPELDIYYNIVKYVFYPGKYDIDPRVEYSRNY